MVVAVVVGLSAKLEQGSLECGHTRVIPRCYRNSNDTRARMVEECLSNPSTDTFIFMPIKLLCCCSAMIKTDPTCRLHTDYISIMRRRRKKLLIKPKVLGFTKSS
jgi:hypothetical protein